MLSEEVVLKKSDRHINNSTTIHKNKGALKVSLLHHICVTSYTFLDFNGKTELTHLNPQSISIPLETVKKREVFWHFQGV